MTYQQAVENACAKLSTISESAKLDAQLLVCHSCNIEQTSLIAHPDRKLTEIETKKFIHALDRRTKGEPIAYITGKKEFWSLEFKVNEQVLIPRPETELLVELTLQSIANTKSPKILELGTGSGAIAIAIAKQCVGCDITATDDSLTALKVARQNAQYHQTTIHFLHSDWFKNLTNGSFDIIISNPPYIDKYDPHLDQFVSLHEPVNALISNNNGLSDLTEIISNAADFLSPSGTLIVEHGYQQSKLIQNLFKNANFCNVITHQDLAGHPRCTSGNL